MIFIYYREVDIWAIGCLYAETLTGDPLFPGESDIDQLFQITKLMGMYQKNHQINLAESFWPANYGSSNTVSNNCFFFIHYFFFSVI